MPQIIQGQIVTFDETQLTDLEVLCYYAYSSRIYTGDPGMRDSLLGSQCGCAQTPGAPVPASARGITRQSEGTCEGSPTSVVISPPSATVAPGGTQQFTAIVPGLANQSVTWSATGGTITTGGLYTAGNTGGSPGGTFQVTATSSVGSPWLYPPFPAACPGRFAVSRFQPPPPQTRRADFRHRAYLVASRHGL